MATSVTFAGNTYSIPAAGELNWSSLSIFLIAVANSAGINTTQKQTVRVATTTPVTVVAATDWAIATNLAAPGAVAVNLPAGVTGQVFFILDEKGDAGTNNITITGSGGQLINGSATLVIDHNRGGAYLTFNGTGWDVLDKTVPPGTITNADIAAAAGIVDTKLATIATALKVSNSATTATSANTASAIVARDVSGNFAAGTITAALSGNATTATSATTAGNVTGIVAIANGGTGQGTTANAAFNALSPLTTKGDLVGFSTVNARVPVGTDGQVLTANSTQATGVSWAGAAVTPTVAGMAYSDGAAFQTLPQATSGASPTYTGDNLINPGPFTITAADTVTIAGGAFLTVVETVTANGALTITSGTVKILA